MCCSCGMVLVTTTASKQALLIRDTAGPEKIPWVRMAYTLVAPASINLRTKTSSEKCTKARVVVDSVYSFIFNKTDKLR